MICFLQIENPIIIIIILIMLLFFIIRYGRYNTVKQLLDSEKGNFIINESDGEGMTPLHIASQQVDNQLLHFLYHYIINILICVSHLTKLCLFIICYATFSFIFILCHIISFSVQYSLL